MKKLSGFWFAVVFVFCLLPLTGCDKNFGDPVGSEIPTDEAQIVMWDSLEERPLGDTTYVNLATVIKVILPSSVSSYSKIEHYENGVLSDTGIMVIRKFTSAATYNYCVKIYTTAQTHDKCKPIYVLPVQIGGNKPIIKKYGMTNLGDQRIVEYGFLAAAIQCTPISNPGFLFWHGSFGRRDFSGPNSEGYYTFKDTVGIGEIVKGTAYGSYNSCWATIAPNPPHWSSQFYLSGEDALGWFIDANGVMQTIGTSTGGGPGTGDPLTGSSSVVQMGPGSNPNYVNIFFKKERVSGNTSNPFMVNNYNGLSSPISISTASGFPDWWVYSVAIDNLPANFVYEFDYGGNYSSGSWAAIEASNFYDPSRDRLAVRIVEIGGRKVALLTQGDRVITAYLLK